MAQKIEKGTRKKSMCKNNFTLKKNTPSFFELEMTKNEKKIIFISEFCKKKFEEILSPDQKTCFSA